MQTNFKIVKVILTTTYYFIIFLDFPTAVVNNTNTKLCVSLFGPSECAFHGSSSELLMPMLLTFQC